MFFFEYIYWHYSSGAASVMKRGITFARGVLNYFSVLHLFRTLFYPWHRYIEPYHRGFYLSEFLTTLAGNIISRVLGAIMRLVMIIFGTVVSVIALIASLAVFVAWLFLPVLLPGSFVLGIILLF